VLVRIGTNQNSLICQWEYIKMVYLPGKSSLVIPQNVQYEHYDPDIPLLNIYKKNLKTNKKYLYINVHSSFIHSSKSVNTEQMSINR
jgi:hypothetical protein